LVWQAVSSRRVLSVSNAKEFGEVLRTKSQGITVIISSDENDKQALESINADGIFQECATIHGISDDHFWEVSNVGATRKHLSPIANCMSQGFEIVNLENNNLSENEPLMQANQLTEELVTLDNALVVEELVTADGVVSELKAGLIVKFVVQKRRNRQQTFLGTILQIKDTHEAKIKCLRQLCSGEFVFPKFDDISWHSFNNITIVSPQPTLNDCGRYVLSNNLLPL
jgi:hypothetical protein